MSRHPRRRLFRLPFKKDAIREEVEEELRFHLDMRSERYEREGLSPPEARRQARRRFGDVERVRDEVAEMTRKRRRAVTRSDRASDGMRDVAFAVRQLLRNPGFSAIAILTIALGIGATTSVFSVVHGILLRPLPYDEPEELVMIWADLTRRDVILPDLRREWLSWLNFADFRDEVGAVEAASAFQEWYPTLTSAGDAEQLDGALFTQGMFSRVLGVDPALGRGFRPDEDVPGPGVVLLSDGLWRRAYGADPAVVGSDVLLDGRPYTVVGVMPSSFEPPPFLGRDLWSLLQLDTSNGGGRGGASFRSVGRLADGASLEVAREQARELGARLEREYPESNTGVGYNVYPLRFDMVHGARSALWVLLGAVGFVLLIACVNVANLLLVRGASRQGELAVRVAMGAGRVRILGQLLMESLVLAAVGGVIGVGLAFIGTRALVDLAPSGTPRLGDVAVDARVLLFAIAVTLVAGVFFGAFPALRASRVEPATTLRQGGRGTPGGGGARLRGLLVTGQIALALVLLIGSGLLVRSFENLQGVDLGFDPGGVLTLQTQMPSARYPDAASRHTFVRSLEERLAAIPGVESVGSVNSLPLAGLDGDVNFLVEGQPIPAPGRERTVWLRRVTPDYFDAMGIELVDGRHFTLADTDDLPQVVIINETMAEAFFAGGAVGKRVNVNDFENPLWREVVGVARDVKNFGIRAESRNAMYVPFYQISSGFMFTVVRTTLEPTSIMANVRREVAAIDPSMAVARLEPMTEWVSESLAADLFTTTLLGGFATVALLLAAVGLYGVVSYSVGARLPEVGVRIALGAHRGSIRRLILGWSLRLAAAGIVVGWLGALAATRLMRGMLFGVDASDPTTFLTTAGLMGATAAAASLVPAIRATRLDPIEVLKAD